MQRTQLYLNWTQREEYNDMQQHHSQTLQYNFNICYYSYVLTLNQLYLIITESFKCTLFFNSFNHIIYFIFQEQQKGIMYVKTRNKDHKVRDKVKGKEALLMKT